MLFPLHKRPGSRKDVPRQRTWFVGKHGDDNNTGLDPNRAVLTITQAVALVNLTGTPTGDNPAVIVCTDAGVYSENVAIPTYTTIIAPSAKVNGNHTFQDFSSLRCLSIETSSGVALTKSAGTDIANVFVENFILLGGTGVNCTAGDLNIVAEYIVVSTGTAIGGASTGNISLQFNTLSITSTGIGLGGTGSGLIVDAIGELIEDTGGSGTGISAANGVTVNAYISRINCAGTATSAAAGGTVNLFTSSYTGTETATGTSNINIADRVVINENEVSSDNQVVRFDGTTGRKVQRSTISINDNPDLLWDTDGGGNIGLAGDDRPGYIYAATELHSENDVVAADDVIASGDVFAQNAVQMGALPAGVADDYGIYSNNTSDTLGLWSTRITASGNLSIDAVADVNNATIDPDHLLFRVGWIDNSDAYTEVLHIEDGQITFSGNDTAQVLGREADGASAIGCRIGSEDSYTTAGARVVEFINNEDVKGFVDKDGDFGFNMLSDGQQNNLETLSELTSITADTTDTSMTIPSGVQVSAVSSYVQTTLGGCSTYDLGVAGATTRYGSALSTTAGTGHHGMDAGVLYYSTATPIRIDPAAGHDGTGAVRITIHFNRVNPPTS